MTVADRPAETGGVASAAALLIARAAGVDDLETVTALAVVIGFVPAAVTFVVELLRRFRPPAPPPAGP